MLDDSTVMINGYSLVRQDRNTQGGGVALYFRNIFKFTELAISDTTGPGKPGLIEYIMGSLNVGTGDPVFISVVYRPPDVSLTNNKYFTDNLTLYSGGDYSTRILMGDFNANFKTLPGTWIDAIFVDSNDTIIDIENRPAPYNNTHNLISVTLDRPTPSVPHEYFTYRPFDKIDPDELNTVLRGYDWSSFDSPSPDLTDMILKLTDNLTHAVDLLAPLRTVIPKKRQPPWVDDELRVLYRKCDAAWRRHKRTGDRKLLDEFFLIFLDLKRVFSSNM